VIQSRKERSEMYNLKQPSRVDTCPHVFNQCFCRRTLQLVLYTTFPTGKLCDGEPQTDYFFSTESDKLPPNFHNIHCSCGRSSLVTIAKTI